MSKIYIAADFHFNHAKIIEYCKRPFDNVDEMNRFMIDQWNSIVNDEDLVYILGDFGFGSVENLTNIVEELNGEKILLMGNHDRRRSVNWWLNFGFSEVWKKPREVYDGIIFSHEPLDVSPDKINIHGHIHNTPLSSTFDSNTHICVSVECINYRPVEIDSLLDKGDIC